MANLKVLLKASTKGFNIWQASLYSITDAYSSCAFGGILSTCSAFDLTGISWPYTNFLSVVYQNILILSRLLMKMGGFILPHDRNALLKSQKTNRSLSSFDNSYTS